MISKKDTEIIYAYFVNEISMEQFQKQFSVDLSVYSHYFRDEWKKAIEIKDSDTIETVLDIECKLNMQKQPYFLPHEYYLSDIRRLIKTDWHKLHEKLIDILINREDDKKDEKIYIYVLHTVFSYYKDVEEDFMVPIWVKCIWKLASIGTPAAIKSVKEQKNSPYEYIRNTVEEQYKKYGW